MRRILVIGASIVFILSLGLGCGKKETEKQPGKVPAEVKKEEMKDTTRMDTAAAETTGTDTTEAKKDSM
jgi:hypothetical protein